MQPGCQKVVRDPRNSARQLARLLERELGYIEGHIDPIALRLLILAHWSKVSYFAHDIHDAECLPMPGPDDYPRTNGPVPYTP